MIERDDIKILLLNDFKNKKTWIEVCKMFGIFLDKNLKCSETNHIIEEIQFITKKVVNKI